MCLEDTVRIPLRARDGSIRAYAIVDAADVDFVNQWRWSLHSTGCAQRSADRGDGVRVIVRLHRALMGLTYGDGLEVDHINHDRLDNRRSNLRVVTHHGNAQNLPAQRGSTSQYRGVYFDKRVGRWVAAVMFNGKKHHGGYFASEIAAADAAKAIRLRLMPYAVD